VSGPTPDETKLVRPNSEAGSSSDDVPGAVAEGSAREVPGMELARRVRVMVASAEEESACGGAVSSSG
jgi:hypothetical protein